MAPGPPGVTHIFSPKSGENKGSRLLMTIKKADALKQFFGVPDKPVTNTELMDFAKNDRQGYDELARLAAAALEESLA